MSLTVTEDFVRDARDLISCHSPLVLKATLQNLTATASSGDVTCDIQAVSFGADDDTLYTFDMAYVKTSFSSPDYYHEFRLNITDIIRKICNRPGHVDETGGAVYKLKSKRATEIDIDVKSSGEATQPVDNWYMHGFNQVNNPDSSCLVDFADVATKAIISIVPGVPMLYYLWNPTNLGGSGTFRLYDSDNNLIDSEAMPDPITFGLVQVSSTGINGALRTAWTNKIEEFYFIIYNAGIQQKVYGVAFKLACEGDVVLAWLNRYGTYSYMAFERFPTHRGEQKHLGEYNITVDDLADVQSRTKSRGYEKVRTVISAVAKGIPTQYMEVVEDLFYSMDVYYYTGTLIDDTFNSLEWLRVTVRGTLVERKKHNQENVRVDIMLPEKYTQVR
jgi:hypothetical protein